MCDCRKLVASAMLAAALLAALQNSVSAAPPIKPGQHFDGLVNGKRSIAVVYTVCPGPAQPNGTGGVAGGQTMSVRRAKAGDGFTGLFSQIYAWLADDSSGPRPQQLTFTTYRTTQPIPPAARVPCVGRGHAVFSSCPYLAPCAAGWVPDYVEVMYVNIAV